MRETEVKIRVPDANGARALLGRTGAVARTPRYFEDNRVYDDGERSLAATRRLLRLRAVGARHVLTYKEPIADDPGDGRYKVRLERETHVSDPAELDAILHALGYSVVYRYQKYRQKYQLRGRSIELDETPIGTFLEIEGTPEQIDQAALALGFSSSDYVTRTYRALHIEHAGSDDPGDLVFREIEDEHEDKRG